LGEDPTLKLYDRVSKTETERWLERVEKHRERMFWRRVALEKRLKSRIRRGFIAPLGQAELEAITLAMFSPPWPHEDVWPKYPH
jgi:hypothetical protein